MDYKKSSDINFMTQLALLFALTIVLMLVESIIPPIPTMPPGVKLGLSNIVLMYCLFFLGKKAAFTILGLKTLFVMITRGVTAFMLSFSGGFCSIIVLIFLLSLKNQNISYIILSVCASITHNFAQLIILSLLLKTSSVFYYFPLLIISGVIMGCITGIILRVMLPAMKRLNLVKDKTKQNKSKLGR